MFGGDRIRPSAFPLLLILVVLTSLPFSIQALGVTRDVYAGVSTRSKPTCFSAPRIGAPAVSISRDGILPTAFRPKLFSRKFSRTSDLVGNIRRKTILFMKREYEEEFRRFREMKGPRRPRVQQALVYLLIAVFLLQVWSAIWYVASFNLVLQGKFHSHAVSRADLLMSTLSGAPPIMVMSNTGNIKASSWGPLTTDFIHQRTLSRQQPHRYLTSGFLHGGLLHLIMNTAYLSRLPSWLETGLGAPLYISAFLVSIVSGNAAHSGLSSIGNKFMGNNNMGARMFTLGASGGICGLKGLQYVALKRMNNGNASNKVLREMLGVLVYGMLTPGVSTIGHVGGFFGGILVGLLFGPGYRSSYAWSRKFSVNVDNPSVVPPAYRQVIGFGKEHIRRGWLPLWSLWLGIAVIGPLAWSPLRAVPACILRAILQPGKLSGLVLI